MSRTIDLTADDTPISEDSNLIDLPNGQQFPVSLLVCLEPDQWLNDEVVNGYCSLVCRRHDTGVVDSLSTDLWWRNGRRPAARAPRFVIVNEGNMHWSLIEIHRARRIIYWYNNQHEMPTLQRTLTTHVSPDHYTWEWVREPTQRDGTECGVLVCWFLYQRLVQLVPADALVLPPPLLNVRGEIRDELLAYTTRDEDSDHF